MRDKEYIYKIKQKENISLLFSKNQVNYEEYLEQYYYNYDGLLKLIKSKDPQKISLKDYNYTTEKNHIGELELKLGEFLVSHPEIELPDDVELEEAAKIYKGSQKIDDQNLLKYYAACFYKCQIDIEKQWIDTQSD